MIYLSIQLPQHPSSLFFFLRELMHATCRRFVVGRQVRPRRGTTTTSAPMFAFACSAISPVSRSVQPALRHSVRVWSVVFARLGRLFRNKSSVALDDACEVGTTPSLTAEKQFFFFAACDLMRSLLLLSMQASSGTGQRSNSEFRGAGGR